MLSPFAVPLRELQLLRVIYAKNLSTVMWQMAWEDFYGFSFVNESQVIALDFECAPDFWREITAQ